MKWWILYIFLLKLLTFMWGVAVILFLVLPPIYFLAVVLTYYFNLLKRVALFKYLPIFLSDQRMEEITRRYLNICYGFKFLLFILCYLLVFTTVFIDVIRFYLDR